VGVSDRPETERKVEAPKIPDCGASLLVTPTYKSCLDPSSLSPFPESLGFPDTLYYLRAAIADRFPLSVFVSV
jgi:hypothetical protein